MANNNQKQNVAAQPEPNNVAGTTPETQNTPAEDNRTWLGKLRDRIVEAGCNFKYKHPTLTKWTRRAAKATGAVGLVWAGYEIGKRQEQRSVPVVTITGSEDEEDKPEENELSEEKVWEE